MTDTPTPIRPFIHPSSAHGTVIQLAQWIDAEDRPSTVDTVKAGQIYSLG